MQVDINRSHITKHNMFCSLVVCCSQATESLGHTGDCNSGMEDMSIAPVHVVLCLQNQNNQNHLAVETSDCFFFFFFFFIGVNLVFSNKFLHL